MDKPKMKSILPKQSSLGARTPSNISGSKRNAGSVDYSAKRVKESPSASSYNSPLSPSHSMSYQNDSEHHTQKQARPVTSCTFCRQHKIKCNALQNAPAPCTRCSKLGLSCEIDPQFKPKKGSQIQMLIGDVEEMKAKIELLTKNEHLLTQALTQHNLHLLRLADRNMSQSPAGSLRNTPYIPDRANVSHAVMGDFSHQIQSPVSLLGFELAPGSAAPVPSRPPTNLNQVLTLHSTDNSPLAHLGEPSHEGADEGASPKKAVPVYKEFILGDVRLSLEKADELHDRFVAKLMPFMPIFSPTNATELYVSSQLLFWTVMLTASLSEPEPGLYMSLASLIKQLAIETCWIRTPRSTHVIQALIILAIWPLPNEKVLDDCSYRFVGLAKNLSLQLGLHRGGEFILEFTRTQANLGPESDIWRTRSWLAVFFCDQFWSSALGLPPSINSTDYLLENARVDLTLPSNFRSLISLSIFQCKLVNVMGISVTRSDGLLEPLNRAASLNILDRELKRLKFKLNITDGSSIEIYYLYLRLMICCFAFLPGTPVEDQVKYVGTAYLSLTRIITIASQLLSMNSVSLIELPIFVRQAITYSAFLLFKLHLSQHLMDNYLDSARQSIVTVHRLYRNTLSLWKDLQNDISRTAKVLEDLNIVLYTYPEIFVASQSSSFSGSIISRMRSHLTASLFYDLVWYIHEAKKRKLQSQYEHGTEHEPELTGEHRPQPLPFYNQITKDDFRTITTTTPNGTTITTLVPTDEALNHARMTSGNEGNKPLEINGIPISMLEATGSTKDLSAVRSPEMFAETSSSGLLGPDGLEMGPSLGMSQRMGKFMGVKREEAEPGNLHYQTENDEEGKQASMGEAGREAGMANQLDSFFQQQSNGWLTSRTDDDDFLGWIDVNMIPDH